VHAGGKIGVLVGLKSSGDKAKLAALGKQIAMHVAAARPLSGRVEDLDPTVVEREKSVLADQARASGKPAVIELRIDPEAITTSTTLTAIREKALERRK